MTISKRIISKESAVDKIISEQFLAAEFDEVEKLQEESKKYNYKTKVVYRNVALFAALHVGSLIGLYQVIFEAKWQTLAWLVFLYIFGGLGITAGAHRLWSHRSFRAKLPLRILLMIMNTSALQNDIIEWARDHRCHHKWTDTDADPHNTRRGFFFAHMGWLLVRKHPQVKNHGKKLDLSDLFADPVCTFQRKYYKPLVLIFCFLLPTAIPAKFWGESVYVAFYTAGLLRYCLLLHATWLINSAAHWFGFKPYDKNISPVESVWTTVSAMGEGGHNFHHTFPQDYRTSEYSLKFNWTKLFIDVCAALGLVYDRKSFSDAVIQRQCEKHGDPSIRGKAFL
ncbi:Delta(9)-fatty-acid desaturase fat-6 [Parelaphostrongylus tenuis]|uniref:Delta(9)-fatty-acid desaturase fat-6 n=1 Tax=Parelaphostrongylus tenuis TaxID=148309 RepID=A0AAD5R361_PARTN|nr:Delta(9)-fatty-acid desaturase fat-6 [Parelaphostrongylus tenuis]